MNEDVLRAVIWLVDDSAMQAEITRRSLELRHTVVVFSLVGPMLERLSAGERPDLLILDWNMPEVSGLDACRFVRSLADGAELPIIILTATEDHDDLLRGMDAGANDFVRKACSESELHARVMALVQTKRLHSRLAATEAALRDEAGFRERFLAILAHDLRQPLNVFALGSETLAASGTAQEVRDHVKGHFDRATGRMQRMIGELLDFSRSRPQGGGMPISAREIDLVPVVWSVVEEVRVAHPARSVATDICESCVGRWDADRLAQVVSNLLENAIAHSEPASTVTLALCTTKDGARIVVDNHGPPIGKEVQATLFAPFRRGANSRRGLGLGLYIVDQIAKAHGGSVMVQSDESKTQFEVIIPRTGSNATTLG